MSASRAAAVDGGKPARRAHHVRRHHAGRDRRSSSSLRRTLRLPGVPRDGDRRADDGEARRQRPARRRASTSRRPRSPTSCSAACCRRRRIGFDCHRAHASSPMSARSAPATWSISGRPRRCPSSIAGRLFYRHNANVTLMRTTPDECRAIGEWIGDKLNRCDGPRALPHPRKGRVGARHRGRRLLRPGRPTPRCSTRIEAHVQRTAARRLIQRLPLTSTTRISPRLPSPPSTTSQD